MNSDCLPSFNSIRLQQNSDSLQGKFYLTRKHFGITYTGTLNSSELVKLHYWKPPCQFDYHVSLIRRNTVEMGFIFVDPISV